MDSFDTLDFHPGAVSLQALALASCPVILLVLVLVFSAHLRLSSQSLPPRLVEVPSKASMYVYLDAKTRKLVFSETPLPSIKRKQPGKTKNKLHAVLRAYRPPLEDLIEESEVTLLLASFFITIPLSFSAIISLISRTFRHGPRPTDIRKASAKRTLGH